MLTAVVNCLLQTLPGTIYHKFYTMKITFSKAYQQMIECCHQQFGSSIYKETHRV